MKKLSFISLLVILAVLLSSCQLHTGLGKIFNGGGNNSSSGTPTKHVKATHTPPSPSTQSSSAPSTPAAPVATPSGPATVTVGTNAKYGSILTDDKGMTLYLLTKDTPNTTTCYDKCAASWLALLTNGNPVAGNGVDASKFGTTTRTDGTTQVTYNGWPLYYFAKDSAPGDTKGQGVNSVWYVVSPAGDKITTP